MNTQLLGAAGFTGQQLYAAQRHSEGLGEQAPQAVIGLAIDRWRRDLDPEVVPKGTGEGVALGPRLYLQAEPEDIPLPTIPAHFRAKRRAFGRD